MASNSRGKRIAHPPVRYRHAKTTTRASSSWSAPVLPAPRDVGASLASRGVRASRRVARVAFGRLVDASPRGSRARARRHRGGGGHASCFFVRPRLARRRDLAVARRRAAPSVSRASVRSQRARGPTQAQPPRPGRGGAFRAHHGIKKVHVASLYREIFRRSKPDFSEAPDVSARDAALFADNFVVCTSEVIDTKVTADGTGAKLVVRLHDGRLVETVVIGHRRDSSASASSTRRNTVCVSSQVGCAMGCTFCETGTMGLLANLTAGEIAEQVWHARRLVGALGRPWRRHDGHGRTPR